MATDMKVTPVDSTQGSSTTEPPKFSIAQGFTELKSLLHPDQNYDYPCFGGGKIRLNSSEFSPEVLEGMLFFFNWLPHETYSESLTTFSTSARDLKAAAAACEQIATSAPQVTVDEFATAIRKTLRDVNNTLYTTHTNIPDKVHGQLIACLVFAKDLPKLPDDISKSADTLLDHIRNIGVSKNTDAIYYHIRDDFSTYFQKTGSWTKTGNALVGWAFGYKI